MTKENKPELAACLHCGSEAYDIDPGHVSCNNEECCLYHIAFHREQWNRRYICPDMHGKPVYAGDKVNYKFPNWKNKFKQCYVTEFRPPFYGYGLTADDDTDFTAEGFYSHEIELIQENDHEL